MTEIDNALDYRRVFAYEDSWNKLELDYLNAPGGDTSVGPNLIYSMGDSLLSSLTVPDPEFVLTAEHPNFVDRRPVVEAVDNWLVGKLNLKDAVDDALLNSYLASRAIIKIGYDSEYGWSPYYDVGKGNNLLGLTLTQFDKKGKRIESPTTEPGMPWVSAVHPTDFVVPWGTRYQEKAPWVAHRVIRLNADIKADPKYKNTSRLEPDVSMETYMNSYSGPLSRKVKERYKSGSGHKDNTQAIFNELWEIKDRLNRTIMVISPGYDEFLRNDLDALSGLSYVSATFVSHPRSFWSTPQAYYLGQIQKDSYDISVQATKQRRINCLRMIAAKGVFTVDELNKLISGNVGAMAIADAGGRSLKDVLSTVPTGSNLDLVMASNNARRDARDAVGYSRNQLGEFDSSSRRTAREATFVREGSQKRESRRSGVVTKLYIGTIKKVNQIIFKYWRMPRYMMVGSEWVKFTGEELKGDYGLDVSLSSKRNISMAERKIEALMLLGQLAPMLPPENVGALYKYLIDASGDPEFSSIFASSQSGGQKGPAASQGGLPTIPATGGRK